MFNPEMTSFGARGAAACVRLVAAAAMLASIQGSATPASAAGAAAATASTSSALADSVSLGDDLYVKRIGEGLWLYVSTRLLDGRPAPANGVMVVGARGAIVIDTPWEDDQTARLLDWFDRAIHRPLLACVVTHSHDDRMGGIRTMQARGVPTYGSALTAELAREAGHPSPGHTFEDHLGLSTGSDSLDVFYPGPAHTRDNVVVWLPARRVLVGGCMIRNARTRSLGFTGDADLAQWPVSLAKVRARCPDPLIVIPGHGAIGGVDALANTERLLAERAAQR